MGLARTRPPGKEQEEKGAGTDMGQKDISFNMAAEGTVLHCPVRIMLGKRGGVPVFYGTLQWGKRTLSHSLELMGDTMPDQLGGYVDDLLPDQLPEELTIYYEKNWMEIRVQDAEVLFKIARTNSGAAILFAFEMQDVRQTGQNTPTLLAALRNAADFFGIREFLFYAQTGRDWMFPRLAPAGLNGSEVPADIQSCSFLTCAHISMEGDSALFRAMRTLFGLKEADLYIGAADKEFLCMIRIPSFDTALLKESDLYMWMELGSRPGFIIRGSFALSNVPGLRFKVDCGVRENAFELEAFAQVEKPVPLFAMFSIGDTCLMIRVSDGFTVGMYTNLYIRKIRIFGAIILQIEGSAIVPELLSAAVSDLSIPILMDNLLGDHLDGIEALDFIKIMGLPFQDFSSFDSTVIEKKNIHEIVSQFNSELKNASLRLDESQVQLTSYEEGLNVTDLKRMRHYFIDRSGQIKLMAQFYYATKDTTLGSYKVERGLFICAVIEIFGKAFEVLFSFREGEGLLAYAKIPAMDLGFLKIGPSGFGNGDTVALPVAEDSVLAQFIPPKRDGFIFFLAASDKQISFYLDGMVEFLKLFRVDARIIYCQRKVTVDLRTVWLQILQISLHLNVDYSSFSKGGFEFCLMIDTAPLTEKLVAVTKKIDNAIGKLKDKINNAKREIDRAQAHVNELYGQIQNFDQKISRCRQEISNAGWLKKAFVAVAKGIEIGAYEVAKAGIYASIGIATATLQAAKKIVELSGKLGEDVMKAVNAVIKGAMTLFYIHYLKLEAKADTAEQYFRAEIQFVALGKTYTLRNEMISIKALEDSPEGALSGVINDKLEPDLANIENGAFRSNWQKYHHENYTVEQHCKRLGRTKTHLDASVLMLTRMQNTYIRELQVPMEEFDEINVSMVDALDHVETVLNMGVQTGDIQKLADPVDKLRERVASQEKEGVFRDGELSEMKEVIAQYDEARLFYKKVRSSVSNVREYRETMEQHQEAVREKTRAASGRCIVNETNGTMANVLSQVEQQMYENFPVDRSGADFINLSREPLIRQCFAEAESELGAEPAKEVQVMRSRSGKGSYKSRL